MTATPAERAQMDAAIAEVRRLLATAQAKAADIRSREAGWLSALVTDAERQVAKAIEDLGPRVTEWATTRRRDAEDGRRADGSAYTVARFLELGRDLASAATLYTKESWNASLFSVAVNTATATAADVGKAAATVVDPSKWSNAVKVGLVVVGLVVVLAVAAPYVRRLPGG